MTGSGKSQWRISYTLGVSVLRYKKLYKPDFWQNFMSPTLE